MVQAYLVVSAAAGEAERVLAAVRELDAVAEAHVVAGEWDLVVEMEAETVADLLRAVTADVRNVEGVGTTRCYVCLE